uniref:Uncharacterized protein n=1 Tax=Magnetococcus massalia (strain MO-1) TaxID=451514 RepID=A0A1S7LCN9_MAGMO|nr:conserved protein of unknown function [Candidatus Magnetococcus massalia]
MSEQQIILELDETRVLIQGDKATSLSDLSEVTGDRWLVSDFQGAICRLMMVDAPAKFADHMLQRKLQEMGEGDENSRILGHWKQARGQNSSEVLFTVVPASEMSLYDDIAFESDGVHLNFSFNALLYGCLRKYGAKETAVVLFEHDRHVDYMVGQGNRVLAAGRLSSYASTDEAKQALAESIAEELKLIQKESHQKIEQVVHFGFFLDGVPGYETDESGASAGTVELGWVEKLANVIGCSAQVLPTQRLALDSGGHVISSVQAAMENLTGNDAANPQIDKGYYYGQRFAPIATAAAWVIVVVATLIGSYYASGVQEMQAKARQIKSQMGSLQNIKAMSEEELAKVGFAHKLSKLQGTVDYRSIIADLSEARGERPVILDRVRVNYIDYQPLITLEGHLDTPFAEASREQEAFLNGLRAQGYTVVKSDLNTDIQMLTFTVVLKRSAS